MKKEIAERGEVEVGAGLGLVVVISENFGEALGGAGCLEVAGGVVEGDQGVLVAVEEEHGDLDAGEFADRVIPDAAEGTNGQPGEEFGSDIGNGGEGGAEDQAAQAGVAESQFRGDAAAEAFAVGDDFVLGEALGAEPSQGGFGVEVGSGFGRPPLALSVATIVIGQDVDAEIEQESVELEAVTDVAAVSVADEEDDAGEGAGGGSGKEPGVDADTVGGGEVHGLPSRAEIAAVGPPGTGGLVDVVEFEPAEEEPQAEQGEAEEPDPGGHTSAPGADGKGGVRRGVHGVRGDGRGGGVAGSVRRGGGGVGWGPGRI